jgi:hypothetical protein
VIEENNVQQVATVTVRQDADEPRLKVRIYRDDVDFYIRIESNHPAIPVAMPRRINVTNFEDAKDSAEEFLYFVRGMFREILGKSPGLPEHLKDIEQQMPAFVQFLLTSGFVGRN